MTDFSAHVKKWFSEQSIQINDKQHLLFQNFAGNEQNRQLVEQILACKNKLMKNWEIDNRVADIKSQPIPIPNGTVGKPYQAAFDLEKLGWQDIVAYELEGLEKLGLQYHADAKTISGVPGTSGDLTFTFRFKIADQEAEAPFNKKLITLIINPDPRSLWKNIESEQSDLFWKPDTASNFATLGSKSLVVASKRGRSHANAGLYRDDDYAYAYFENTGWSIIAVADGAGSAKLSRQGSRIACNEVVQHFREPVNTGAFDELDQLVQEHNAGTGDDIPKKINHFVYNQLGKAAFTVHKKLEEFASTNTVTLKDLHSTLIFAMFKKYEFGYAILSFSVGDCPIGLISKDMSSVALMNWLDVGEFGGGTRFITMPEIFTSDKFHTRFGFKLVDDFSYLMLMTDGIYDPKFEVEANLEKIERWKLFIDDLQGQNPENVKVDFSKGNPEVADQLLTWMDFWSTGNHDDRTLAVIY